MKGHKGITLLVLTITIIIMFLIAGTTISLFGGESIIKNSKTAVEQSTIESKKNEIEQIIIKIIKEKDKDITKEDIIEELVNEGIINEGDGNSDNGQVKTQPDGYIYEIKEATSGNWEIKYIGQWENTIPNEDTALCEVSGAGASETKTFTIPSGVNVIKIKFNNTYPNNRPLSVTLKNCETDVSQTISKLRGEYDVYVKTTPGVQYEAQVTIPAGDVSIVYSKEINEQTPDFDLTS